MNTEMNSRCKKFEFTTTNTQTSPKSSFSTSPARVICSQYLLLLCLLLPCVCRKFVLFNGISGAGQRRAESRIASAFFADLKLKRGTFTSFHNFVRLNFLSPDKEIFFSALTRCGFGGWQVGEAVLRQDGRKKPVQKISKIELTIECGIIFLL
jgi:hypothetical protein